MSWLTSRARSLITGVGSPADRGAASPDPPVYQAVHPALICKRGRAAKGQKNVIYSIIARQQTGRLTKAVGSPYSTVSGVISKFRDRLDHDFSGIPNMILELETAIRAYCAKHKAGGAVVAEWRAISDAVVHLAHKLMPEGQAGPNHNHDSHGGVQDQLARDREVRSGGGGSMARGRWAHRRTFCACCDADVHSVPRAGGADPIVRGAVWSAGCARDGE
jgi:hypothetical protein